MAEGKEQKTNQSGALAAFLLQRISPTQGLNLHLLMSPALAGRFFTTSVTGKATMELSYLICTVLLSKVLLSLYKNASQVVLLTLLSLAGHFSIVPESLRSSQNPKIASGIPAISSLFLYFIAIKCGHVASSSQ